LHKLAGLHSVHERSGIVGGGRNLEFFERNRAIIDYLDTSEEEESSRRSGKDAVSDEAIAVDEEDFARVDLALPP
jgi:hypothetical protein